MTPVDVQDAEARADHLLVEVKDGVAWLRMNRPEVLNALSANHFRQLTEALHDVGWREDVGVVVLTGTGKVFCAGGDVRTIDKDALVKIGNYALQTLLCIVRCPKPVIAMVNGDAIGGGNELVIACDFAVAARSARLGQGGTKLGWAPVLGGTNFLAMSIGDKRSKAITYLSRIVSATTAEEWGWVNETVDDDELEAATLRWCDEILARAPEGLHLAKVTANHWWDVCYPSISSGLSMIHMGVSEDAITEGTSAFLERRRPDWSKWRGARSGAR